MTRVLVLKTGEPMAEVAAASGSFAAMFERGLNADPAAPAVGVEALDVTTRSPHHPPPPLHTFHGVIMTGSPAYVDEDAPWMRWGAEVLRTILRQEVPFLGVCFGHQLLGVSLGAHVGRNPTGREMGTIEVETEPEPDDPLFGPLPRRFAAQCSHRDVVLAPSGSMRVFGRAPHDPHHAVRVGPRAWGVQFHPEFDAHVMRAYLHARREGFEADRGAGASATRLAAVQSTPHAASVLTRFAQLCRDHEAAHARRADHAGGPRRGA